MLLELNKRHRFVRLLPDNALEIWESRRGGWERLPEVIESRTAIDVDSKGGVWLVTCGVRIRWTRVTWPAVLRETFAKLGRPWERTAEVGWDASEDVEDDDKAQMREQRELRGE